MWLRGLWVMWWGVVAVNRCVDGVRRVVGVDGYSAESNSYE